MMISSRVEEDKNIEGNIIKDERNLYRSKKLKKEAYDLFSVKKENKAMKDSETDIQIRNNRNLFEHGERKNHYKPARECNI